MLYEIAEELGLQDKLKKFLSIISNTDKSNHTMKSFLDDLVFISKYRNTFSEYFSKLEAIIEANPKDAQSMTVDEFIEAHQEILIDTTNEAFNTDKDISHLFNGESYDSDSANAVLHEALKSILPKKHIKPNNKLANQITKDFLNEGSFELVVSRPNSKKEILTRAMLTYDGENISLTGRVKFTPYDREVHDAVITLFVAGNEIITPEMVYRAMNGMVETDTVSPQSVASVTKSLDKSMLTRIKIDFSQEAQAYKKNCKAMLEAFLFECRKVTVTTGGRTKEAYKFTTKPILYEYAQITKQIITVPIGLLQTKEAVRSTEDVIVIRGYLLRQIEGMKSKVFKRNNHILYSGVYSELDISPDSLAPQAYKDKTNSVRKHVNAILSEWIKQEYITNYEPYKEKKYVKGISITY